MSTSTIHATINYTDKAGQPATLDFYKTTARELRSTTTEQIGTALAAQGFGGLVPQDADDAIREWVEQQPVATILHIIDGELEEDTEDGELVGVLLRVIYAEHHSNGSYFYRKTLDIRQEWIWEPDEPVLACKK